VVAREDRVRQLGLIEDPVGVRGAVDLVLDAVLRDVAERGSVGIDTRATV
jgi:hypothetical protein